MSTLNLTEQTLLRIAAALEKLASASQPLSPDHRFPIGDFANFDWASIGARVIKSDRTGAGVVEWNGYTFVRRVSESNKMGKAILFSRNDGMDENGAKYHTLVRFTDSLTLDELPDSIVRVAGSKLVVVPTPEEPPAKDPAYPAGKSTDWEQEALHAEDELLFDTAIAKLFKEQFAGDSKKALSTRRMVCADEFKPQYAAAFLATIRTYVNKRSEFDREGLAQLDSHNKAKAAALNVYSREISKAK